MKILMLTFYGHSTDQEIMKRQNVINPYHTTGQEIYTPEITPPVFKMCRKRPVIWYGLNI